MVAPMFKDLLSRLTGDAPDPAPLSGDDAELAIAALLVRVARADDHYTAVEQARIDRVLARRLDLSPDAAATRRAAAEALEAEAADTVRFTRQIKDRIALDDRKAVLGALWEIACADAGRDQDEDALIRLIAGLLGVPDRDSARMRQQVLARMDARPA